MKKAITILMLLSFAFLTSCTETKNPMDIALAFCDEYPLDATVYYSSAAEDENGYIDTEMLMTIFSINNHPVNDYALVLYGKVSTVRELGVFVTRNSNERMKVTELAPNRIRFLESFVDGEGFIKKYRTMTVYGFVDDASRAEWLLDNLI